MSVDSRYHKTTNNIRTYGKACERSCKLVCRITVKLWKSFEHEVVLLSSLNLFRVPTNSFWRINVCYQKWKFPGIFFFSPFYLCVRKFGCYEALLNCVIKLPWDFRVINYFWLQFWLNQTVYPTLLLFNRTHRHIQHIKHVSLSLYSRTSSRGHYSSKNVKIWIRAKHEKCL